MPRNRRTYRGAKKQAYLRKISLMDNLGVSTNQFLRENEMTVVENCVGDFIDRVHNNINSNTDFVVTGKIADITMTIENNKVNVYAYPHLIYQDRGVSGVERKRNTIHSYTDKRPPVRVFKEWIKRRNFNLRNNRKYDRDRVSRFEDLSKEKQIEQAAWAMSTKIYKEGFEAKHIYSKEIPELIDDLVEQIADFTIQSIVQVIDVKPEAKRVIISR